MSAIVQVVTTLERGGAQRLALELAAGLSRPDRPAYLLTGPGPDALDEEAADRLGARLLREPSLVVPLQPARDLRALLGLHRRLAALADAAGPLVVHTHSSKAGILGRLAGRGVRGARTVHTVHGFGVDALGPRWRPWLIAGEQVASAATDVLTFVSRADLASANELRLSSRPRRVVVPASCDEARLRSLDTTAKARAAARARLGIPQEGPLAVTIGNLKPQKDPLFHVDVLAVWRERTPGAQLLFLGDGPLREATEERARARGVQAALHLPGFLPSPDDALVAADVALLASRWEGLPLSVLEALATGLAVVVRNPGWADDLTFAGARLRALPPSAPAAAFAAALEEQRRLPRTAVELPPRFTWPGTLAAVDALYDELLGS